MVRLSGFGNRNSHEVDSDPIPPHWNSDHMVMENV